MADSASESENVYNGLCYKLTNWAKRHFLAMNIFVVGVVGAVSSAFLIEDADWKVTCFAYLNALAACSVVCLICRRGSLYYKSIDDARERFLGSRQPAQVAQSKKKPENSEVMPLLSEQQSNYDTQENTPPPLFDIEADRDELKFSTFKGPYKKPEGAKTETGARPKHDQEQTVIADVHHSGSLPASPVAASPYRATPENESTSSGAVPSDPQNSTTSPDSGITAQTTAQTPQSSGEEQQRPPVPEL